MEIRPISLLRDNFGYIVTDSAARKGVIVDPSEAGPVIEALHEMRLDLAGIWLTHHHWDHVGGLADLLKWASAPLEVLGSQFDLEAQRIPGQTRGLADGERFSFGHATVEVVALPGHTLGSIAYRMERPGEVESDLFTGDTLFLGGCGRMFEGNPEMMTASLGRIRALPPGTRIWCGHEYTRMNLEYARRIEPHNVAIAQRILEVDKLLHEGRPTVPGRLSDELETNPFLRIFRAEICKGRTPAETFSEFRAGKNVFSG